MFRLRLERMSQSLNRVERNQHIALEAFALFVRYELGITPQLPVAEQAAAHAVGRDRFQQFMDQVSRRMAGECRAALRPYSIRHGMAREMRKHKVPSEQISLFLGHLPKGSDATTSIYAPYEPDYCADAVAAIESVMAEVRSHLRRANIDQTELDVAKLARTVGTKNRRGVGDAKREEVRFLILSGLPHAEVVRRSGVSSGTVSLIRKELRQAVPLYRNSEPGL